MLPTSSRCTRQHERRWTTPESALQLLELRGAWEWNMKTTSCLS
jgi:hypothetical protein